MTASLFEQLQERAKLCGIELTAEQLDDISKYCIALTTYNEHVNLISRCDLDFLLFEHVLDSLTLIPLIEKLRNKGKTSLVDIGSGAGFPGLILALACPELHVTLIESTSKKCKFLDEAAATLNLNDRVQVINDRAEVLGHDLKYRNKFQFATSRAVGSLELIVELAVPLLEKDGYLLAQKSKAQVDDELASGKKILSEIGAKLEEVVSLNKDALGKERVVLIIKRVRTTPKQFPRAFSKMPKRKL